MFGKLWWQFFWRCVAALVLLLAASAAALFWYLQQPLPLALKAGQTTLELVIEPGTTGRRLAQRVVDAGVQWPAELMYWGLRLSGQSRMVRAGNYEITAGMTPQQLLGMLVRGEEALRWLTVVEGWNMRQLRAALLKAEQLRPDSQSLDDQALMDRLGRPGVPAEGRFYPDTYSYAKGSSDLAVLARAMRAMDRQLELAWQQRAANLPLANADQALTLASLVEKETGRAADRAQIAGVFINRLRLGMLLQTDPSVIYGLGAQFDGDLRRRDLQTDHPYNTYTRAGLPPGPIAMPGRAALLAAVQPAQTDALYFVARGDGSSEFNATLDGHNRAVNRYQRRLQPGAASAASAAAEASSPPASGQSTP